jgi:hypothetical protein
MGGFSCYSATTQLLLSYRRANTRMLALNRASAQVMEARIYCAADAFLSCEPSSGRPVRQMRRLGMSKLVIGYRYVATI